MIGEEREDDPASVPPRSDVEAHLSMVDLRCAVCGYGVVVRIAPEQCPMCGGSVWQQNSQPTA
jgi:rubrerythrin